MSFLSERARTLPPYLFARLDEAAERVRAQDRRVISLALGDPERPAFPDVVAAACGALEQRGASRYPTTRGLADLRIAVAGMYRRWFGVELDPEREVVPVLGAKECLFHLPLAVLDPGDVALVPDPGYPVYETGVTLNGGVVRRVALEERLGWTPDLDALPVDARLLYLNYPNNPTGAAAPDGFFADAVAWARRTETLLVHDNPYGQLVYDGRMPASLLAAPGARETAVELFSLSKGYNMAGWRIGALVGNAEVLDGYWRLKSNVDAGAFEVVQRAAVAALAAETDAAVREQSRRYEARRDRTCERLRALGLDCAAPGGGLYVWIRVPSGFDGSVAFSEQVLERTGVLLTPGVAYGRAGDGHVRVALTIEDDDLAEALDCLGPMLEEVLA